MACATVQQRPLPVSASEIRIEQMRQHSKSLIRLFLAVNDTGTYAGAYTHTHPHTVALKNSLLFPQMKAELWSQATMNHYRQENENNSDKPREREREKKQNKI